jgi:hypothetical protein
MSIDFLYISEASARNEESQMELQNARNERKYTTKDL